MERGVKRARLGTGAAVRAWMVLAALLAVLVVAAVSAPEAEAHQRAGRTIVSVDGETVKNTRDDHFTYRQALSPGCHNVQVAQKKGGNVVGVYRQRECSPGRSTLVVEVDHGNVSISTRSKAIVYENPMAR